MATLIAKIDNFDPRWAELEKVILTPHGGGLSYEAFCQMMADAIENIVAFEEGRLTEIESKRIL